MARRALRLFAVAALAAAALFASATSASASGAGRAGLCASFKVGGLKIMWETVGGFSCASAKPWVIKLQKEHVPTGFGNVTLHDGPGGYHCMATGARAHGHPTGGVCYKGTLAYPKSGFTWNGT